MGNNLETAVFGGGCFWCTEAIFQSLRGVESVVSGYAGPSASSGQAAPTYEQVSMGNTGHAEVVKIEFDPSVISFKQLLEVFFATHDAMTPNRQGADAGPQYRSLILYTTDLQRAEAEKFIKPPVVTELKPLEKFYTAEEYHQNYYQTNPDKPYCQVVIGPKLAKLRQKFGPLLKKI